MLHADLYPAGAEILDGGDDAADAGGSILDENSHLFLSIYFLSLSV